MKKKKWWLIIGMTILFLIIGGIVYVSKQEEVRMLQEEMISIVKSDEAKKEFEEVLNNLDINSLTPDGVIQKYDIDFDSINRNPMGGINVVLIVNQNRELTIEYTLNMVNDSIESGGISYSGKLADLLMVDANE